MGGRLNPPAPPKGYRAEWYSTSADMKHRKHIGPPKNVRCPKKLVPKGSVANLSVRCKKNTVRCKKHGIWYGGGWERGPGRHQQSARYRSKRVRNPRGSSVPGSVSNARAVTRQRPVHTIWLSLHSFCAAPDFANSRMANRPRPRHGTGPRSRRSAARGRWTSGR